MDKPQWRPYQESLRITLARNGTIALVVGAALAWRLGGLSHWPMTTLVVLWPALGGHWLELWFLNWLRPRIPSPRAVQACARVGVWLIGGIALAFLMRMTASAGGFRLAHWPALWLGGIAFIGIESAVHVALQLRGRPSFYNGRG